MLKKYHNFINYLLCFLYIIVVLMACHHYPYIKPVKKDGKLYGITKRADDFEYWNYYEKALSFADGDFFEEAVICLKEAIRQNPEDNFRKITYGRHLTDYGYSFKGYFPHRELGIIYYFQKKFQKSKDELEKSYRMYPTDKTKLYLNRVRKAWGLAQKIDKIKPEILIKDYPIKNHKQIYTNKFIFTISGHINDNLYVKEIKINGNLYQIDLIDKKINFEHKIKIKQGDNPVIISAKDIFENESIKKININGDFNGPDFSIIPINIKKGIDSCTADLKGFVVDDYGIVEIISNNEKFTIQQTSYLPVEFCVKTKNENPYITFCAIDLCGNKSCEKINILNIPVLPESQKPHIKMLSHNSISNITDKNTDIIEGIVFDNQGIKSIAINNEKISYIQQCKKLNFSRLVGLNPGKNKIKIIANDFFENDDTKTIEIMKFESKLKQLRSSLRVLIEDFYYTIGDVDEISKGLKNYLNDMVKKRKRFIAIDKSGKNGSEFVLIAYIMERRKSTEIHLRMVDVNTAQIILSVNVYDEEFQKSCDEDFQKGNRSKDSINKWLIELSKKIHVKLEDELPVLKAWVTDIKDERFFFINKGKKEKLKKGMKLYIYDFDEIKRKNVDLSQNQIQEIPFAEGKIVEFMPDNISKVELINDEDKFVKTGNYIITR